MDAKQVFQLYIGKISGGDWHGTIREGSPEFLAESVGTLCHAALLSSDCEQAFDFLVALNDRLLSSRVWMPDNNKALLKQAIDRAADVKEKNGWLAPTEDVQTEEAITNTFPADIFPPMLERYCNSVAESNQVDRAMIGAAVLATSALCMQGRYMVAYPSGNGHREHLCLYIVIISNPGERKSNTFTPALYPVRKWQNEKQETYKQELAEFTAKSEAKHCEIEGIKRKMASNKTSGEEKSILADELVAMKLEEQELTPPASPSILAGDTTVEALSNLMELTGETAGIFTDEADFFKIIAGLYNKGQSGNIGLVLKAYDGTPFDRIRGSGTVRLRRPLLSMCMFTQPVLFEEAQRNADLQGRGMIGRLLFCEPEVMAGKRNVRCSARVDTEAQEAYKQLLTAFLDMEQKSDQEALVIEWADDAKETMLDYLQTIEKSMCESDLMQGAEDYASKAGGAAIRIAGILHLLWTSDAGCITKETAERAIKLHGYFFLEKLRSMHYKPTREQELHQKIRKSCMA